MAKSIGKSTVAMYIDGKWVNLGYLASPVSIYQPPNVIGGSLDGATIPQGTRDGQTLVWSYDRQRWVDKT